jgi:hypothetical protein
MSQTAGAISSQLSGANSGIWKVMVMRVFVAGGTGVVGRRLVPQLVAREPLGDDYDDERGQAELAWRGWARRAS